jgi:hypothetical protein
MIPENTAITISEAAVGDTFIIRLMLYSLQQSKQTAYTGSSEIKMPHKTHLLSKQNKKC